MSTRQSTISVYCDLILRVQISRWDYHATHVNQLYVLAAITDSAQFKETADRSVGTVPLL